jgi:L-amino acid N-acyltransferase YncA
MMIMDLYTLSPIDPADGNAVIDLFNHYIEHSFAAYPEIKVPYQFFMLLMQACANYPAIAVKDSTGSLAGFGMLRPHNPMPAFRHTAEITYFIRPELTGKGLGTKMLEYLEAAGKKQEITTILAGISSLNEGSIRFHERNGFFECGRFVKVGVKKGVVFDIVWMQKFI